MMYYVLCVRRTIFCYYCFRIKLLQVLMMSRWRHQMRRRDVSFSLFWKLTAHRGQSTERYPRGTDEEQTAKKTGINESSESVSHEKMDRNSPAIFQVAVVCTVLLLLRSIITLLHHEGSGRDGCERAKKVVLVVPLVKGSNPSHLYHHTRLTLSQQTIRTKDIERTKIFSKSLTATVEDCQQTCIHNQPTQRNAAIQSKHKIHK